MKPVCLAFILTLSVGAWAVDLPDAPSAARKPNFRAFLVLTLADAGVTAWDGYTTAQFGPRERCDREMGMPRIYGLRPSSGRLATVLGLEFAATTSAAWIMPRIPGLRKLWWAPQSTHITLHLKGAIYNMGHC